MSPEDAGRLALSEGDEVVLENEQGHLRGRVHLAPLKPGNLQVHWPEGQVLIAGDAAHRGRPSGIPDYNAVVRVQSAVAWRVREPATGEPEGLATGGAVPDRRPGDGHRVPPHPPPPSDRPGPTAPPPGTH
jgi:anaerobic selenocysteine-containing dehydrogenase